MAERAPHRVRLDPAEKSLLVCYQEPTWFFRISMTGWSGCCQAGCASWCRPDGFSATPGCELSVAVLAEPQGSIAHCGGAADSFASDGTLPTIRAFGFATAFLHVNHLRSGEAPGLLKLCGIRLLPPVWAAKDRRGGSRCPRPPCADRVPSDPRGSGQSAGTRRPAAAL